MPDSHPEVDAAPPATGDVRPDRATGTQAISRALDVLALVRDAGRDLGVLAIAHALSLRPSTAHRIVRALVADGYLGQDPDTDRYYLGRSAVLLGLAAHRDLGLQAAFPVLEDLGSRTSESVNLGVRDGASALVVLRVESPLPLRFDQPAGTRVPLHASSMGKSLLAFEGLDGGIPAAIERYTADAGGALARFTPTTITTERALQIELTRTRERGHSLDDGESIDGVYCVGAPILGADGRARAAVAVQAPAVRMGADRISALVPLITTAATEIGSLLPARHRF